MVAGSPLPDWLVLVGFALLADLVLLILLILEFGPRARTRRALRKVMRQQYASARGTAHLRLLRQGRARLVARRQTLSQRAQSIQIGLDKAARSRDLALKRRLSEHLVQTELRQVPGIGARLHETLATQVFKNDPDDLLGAERVPGVGPRRQAAISRWVADCKRRMPDLLAGDFPHKRDVLRQCENERSQLQAELTRNESDQRDVARLLERVDVAIAALDGITAADFSRAMREPGHRAEALERYCRGAFGEWESVPDWFAQLAEANPDA